jgi:uncharacterized protein YciI
MSVFAVFITRGAAWQPARPMEEQDGWRPHADFMNALVAEGFVLLGGPLEEPDVLLVVRASSAQEIRERLAPDPWHRMDLLRITRIAPWTLRLGALPAPG